MALAELVAAIPAQYFWIAGKGRIKPSEPLYAIRILDAETDEVVAQAEADTLEDAIAHALKSLPLEAA
ncbi:hypothetical protein [Bradyrhizobium sp. 18]|uniref:hypothetical protein n=1 Tax=Bradyrhizobium sp. 18 TaxID=2782657 RepID=UPI001FFB0520|nr:hypothetical protein [Bradyrhizobium sp. 18]MCK1503889.1 hypothetical protein [Bradyrhizobium sp. 18]